ncbi:TRAP transporter large permease [Halalkalicoccus sp. NIPERK01]|uniref:TRAP transporter large permease n=1 Tax=Halalkalicoccus sp. NIPERK01 TaxID=3053469 RepID=UPI00256ED739|nr:TRAP transporter large permease [Halalkalicoccus sp. NIPERK01]MDL5363846.1 TRAP transporter large permease [Halalkalicoccus sp. NIPERK01]
MIVLLALGVPVLVAIGLGSVLLVQQTGIFPTTIYGSTLFSGLNSFALLAIPLYILTGDAIVESGLSEKLLNFANRIVGGFNSGVGTATLLGCGLFASISGSNSSDAAAIGRISHHHLKDFGYPGPYASALIASGASTGILIPPSITYIIAGTVLGVSVANLFIAGLIPGVLVLVSAIVAHTVVSRLNGYENKSSHSSPREMAAALWDAKFALMIPVIILGGIYSGIFTPTEAAAVAVFVAIAIGMSVREISFSDFPNMLEQSAIVNGIITPIIGIAIVLSQILAIYEVPSTIIDFLIGPTTAHWQVVLTMLAIFLVAGAVMETTPNILILGPLLLPVATEIGMDPIHFVIFMNLALAVGFITPPIGLNLYVMSAITEEDILAIARHAVPYLIAMIVVVVIVAYYAPLSTFTF